MVKRILLIAVITIVVYGLLPTLAQFPQDARDLTEIAVSAILVGVVLAGVSQLAVILLFQRALLALGADPKPPTGIVARSWLAETMLTTLLPGGSVAGAVVSVGVLHREGVDRDKTATAIVLTKLLWWIALLSLAVLGLLLSLGDQKTSSVYVTTATVVIPFFAAGAGTLIYGVFRPEPVVRLLTRTTTWASRYRKVIDPPAISSRAAVVLDKARPMLLGPQLVLNAGLAITAWVSNILILEIMLRSLGQGSSLGISIIAVAVTQVVALVPIPPGGIGVVEIVMVSILAAFGIETGAAVVAVISYRLISYWLPFLFGVGAYFSLRHLRADDDTVTPQSPA